MVTFLTQFPYSHRTHINIKFNLNLQLMQAERVKLVLQIERWNNSIVWGRRRK